MASSQYKMAVEAVLNLLNAEDPSLDDIMKYYVIITQKKYKNININFINKIKLYIEFRQTGLPHKEAFVMAHDSVQGLLYGKYSKTNTRLRNKLAARLK